MSKLVLYQQAADPAAPAAGTINFYAKTDDRLYWQDDAGAAHKILQEGDALADLGDMTSADLAGVVTDEVGSAGGGFLVFNNTPTIITPNLTGQVTFPTTGSGAGLLIGGDTQIYRSAADVITIPDTLVVSGSGGIVVPSGTVIRFDGGVNTGIYESASDVLSIFTNNVDRIAISNSGAAITGSISSTSTASFGGNTSVTGALSSTLGLTVDSAGAGHAIRIGTGSALNSSSEVLSVKGGAAIAASVYNSHATAATLNLANNGSGGPALAVFDTSAGAFNAQRAYIGLDGSTVALKIVGNFGVDLYRDATNKGATLSTAGQFAIPVTGSGAGILIGGDTQLYRSAADVLRTPDSFTVDGALAAGSTAVTGTLSATSDISITANNKFLYGRTVAAAATILIGIDNSDKLRIDPSALGTQFGGAIDVISTISTGASASTGTAVIIDGNNILRPLTSSEQFKTVTQRGWQPSQDKLTAFFKLSPIIFDYNATFPKITLETRIVNGILYQEEKTVGDALPTLPDVLGFSAEEAQDLGLNELLNYRDDLPYSFRDHAIMAYQQAAIKSLERRIIALEKGV